MKINTNNTYFRALNIYETKQQHILRGLLQTSNIKRNRKIKGKKGLQLQKFKKNLFILFSIDEGERVLSTHFLSSLLVQSKMLFEYAMKT